MYGSPGRFRGRKGKTGFPPVGGRSVMKKMSRESADLLVVVINRAWHCRVHAVFLGSNRGGCHFDFSSEKTRAGKAESQEFVY